MRVGQRVRFLDPENSETEIGIGRELRGRITYLLDSIAQVIVDGHSFGIWVAISELVPE